MNAFICRLSLVVIILLSVWPAARYTVGTWTLAGSTANTHGYEPVEGELRMLFKWQSPRSFEQYRYEIKMSVPCSKAVSCNLYCT